ncbi:hypothetical protein PpBr36_04822 [Pyricularia pennisetigena]|uniref:hypothetical protein n=1 Tax=Pyricularia pennisetigena TaxID=1578925 RepID=UPI00115093DA|nr:hypothetical protein PpBr36_04822 [Pyricularia pennisetigena]TLS26765.1 hypothetical protein PpBr36_04822 [Pyricularia pennisetigena]
MAANPVPSKNFKAVIVGGSVSGLTLANIFEQLGIEYVLLEAYDDWAPQVGASIGMLPNGLRILDQIGVMESWAEGVPPASVAAMTRTGGKQLISYDLWDRHTSERFGTVINFADRQKLLQSLYGTLKNKGNLFLNKRVVKVTTSDAGASVETKDGSIYHGDIVIGADGIKSTVRQEMWRNAAEASPGYFPGSDSMKQLPIEHKCLFGISKPHKAMPAGKSAYVVGRAHSYLLIGGPGGRVYYFLFVKLPEKLWGDKTPKYSDEDARALARQYSDELVLPNCTFGELVDGYSSMGMTALHEHVFEKWHCGRIITIGDAAHKLNPISGQGGNSAIESAAAVANALGPALDRLSGSSRLSASDIEAVFREVDSVRHKRAEALMAAARKQQAMNAPEGFFGFHMTLLVPYMLSVEKMCEPQVVGCADAVRVERLPVPFRPHFIPFTDELPAKPIQSLRLPRLVVALVMGALVLMAGHGIVHISDLPDTFLAQPFRTVFTSNPIVDKILLALTKIFAMGLTSPIPEQYLQMVYFLPMLAPLILIWVVEANRRGNQQTIRGTILTWPSIFALACQLLSVARTGPLYFLITLLIGIGPIVHRPSSRVVDADLARTVLPATILGFVVPTVLMLTPQRSQPSLWLDLTTVWQISPLIPGPLAAGMAHVLRAHRGATRSAKSAGDDARFEIYRNRDLPHLLRAYGAMLVLTAALHVGVVGHIAASWSGPAPLSLAETFLRVPLPWGPDASAWHRGRSAVDVAFVLFKWDLLTLAAALLVWCLWSVLEVRRMGYVTTREACRVALAVPAALALVGPGAMYAGTWYWREKTIAGVSRMEEGAEKKKNR